MSSSESVLIRFFAVIVSLVVVCGQGSTPRIAADDAPISFDTLPKHFILNPDCGRPVDYPAEIPLKELEAFLKTQRMTGQGCGGMTWEGVICGMFCNTYAATSTPWLKGQVELDACYAETKTGNVLVSLKLGRNRYSRADRNTNKLIWAHNYEPEYEQHARDQICYGQDSGKRKELLLKINASFRHLALAQFPTERRELLKLQLRRCENDRDPEVVRLAREIGRTLTLSDSAP